MAKHSTFCDTEVNDDTIYGVTQPVLNGTRTGLGPNTFVTAGVTITSPSVAISLAGVSRQDGCYTTIDNTIIPVDADSVTSIRGGGIGYLYYPFQYQHLNYECIAANGSLYVADGSGPDCYTVVPSIAYFNAPTTWSWANACESIPDEPCSVDPVLSARNGY